MNLEVFKDIKYLIWSHFLKSFISNVTGDETYRVHGDIISRTPNWYLKYYVLHWYF